MSLPHKVGLDAHLTHRHQQSDQQCVCVLYIVMCSVYLFILDKPKKPAKCTAQKFFRDQRKSETLMGERIVKLKSHPVTGNSMVE